MANLMAATWTRATRAQRRLKAGRPSKAADEMSTLDAVYRTVTELRKAHTVLAEEGLETDSLSCALTFYRNGKVEELHVGEPTDDGAFRLHQSLHKKGPVSFLGIEWELTDSEETQEGWEGEETLGVPSYWRTKFGTYPKDDAALVSMVRAEGWSVE